MIDPEILAVRRRDPIGNRRKAIVADQSNRCRLPQSVLQQAQVGNVARFSGVSCRVMSVQYAPTLEVSVWDHKEGLGKSIKLGDAKLKVRTVRTDPFIRE